MLAIFDKRKEGREGGVNYGNTTDPACHVIHFLHHDEADEKTGGRKGLE